MSNEYANEYEEAVNKYLEEKASDETNRALVEFTQKYLEERGYDTTRSAYIGRFLTSGTTGKVKEFFDSNWDFIESLDLSERYNIYSTLTDFGPDLVDIISNISTLDEYRNEDNTYTAEGKEKLEKLLSKFLSVTGNLLSYIPGGDIYSFQFAGLDAGISEAIDAGEKHYAVIEYTSNMVKLNMSYYGQKYRNEFMSLQDGDWENGPSIEIMSQAYNNNSTDKALFKELFGQYINWRIQYEFELELKAAGIDPQEYYDIINGMYVENPEELQRIEYINSLSSIESVPDITPSQKIIYGTSKGESLSNMDPEKVPLTISGFGGDDTLSGSNFDDKLYGGSGNDRIYGYDGNDYIMGEYGDDRADGGAGDDILYGGYGNDRLEGGAGNDILCGGMESDLLCGGEGDDSYIFYNNFGDDIINEQNANSTNDTVIFGSGITPEDVMVVREGNDMVLNVKSNGTIKIYSQFIDSDFQIESFVFSNGETVTAEDYFNTPLTIEGSGSIKDFQVGFGTRDATLIGSDATDQIYGYKGNDILMGGKGNDYLYGAEDDDTYIFNIGDGNDTINEHDAASENDIVIFGEGITPEDITVTRYGNDMILKVGDNDTLKLTYQYIHNSYKIESFVFSNGEVITAEDYFNTPLTIEGSGSIKDFQVGFGTRDATLIGSDATDQIYGYKGNDTLMGGKGNDYLYGAEDDDTYIFNIGDGNDTINEQNSNSSNDTVRFGEGISAENIYATQSGNNLVLGILGTEDSITITNHFSNTSSVVENFELSDGRATTNVQLNQLIQSMASFESETGMLWNDAVAQNDENAISIIDNIWMQKPAV